MNFFKNLGHYAALAIRDIAKFGKLAQQAEPFIEDTVKLVYPSSAEIINKSHDALARLVDAADKVEAVQSGSATLTVEVTSEVLADLKSLATFFRGHAAANGVALPTPATTKTA